MRTHGLPEGLGLPVYNLLGGTGRRKAKDYAKYCYRVEHAPEELHASAKRAVSTAALHRASQLPYPGILQRFRGPWVQETAAGPPK